MDQTLWIVWAVLAAVAATLGLVGFWFSLRTLRVVTTVIALGLTIPVTRFGLAHPEYRPANLVDSFLSGVDQITIALLHPLWPGRVPVPGVAGRWVIVVLLFLGYRLLEWWTLRWQAPELDMSAIGRGRPADQGHASPTALERHSQLASELRFRLPTMEVRAPSILPGGTRTNALASIAETSGLSGAGMVSAVLRFAGMIWPNPRLIRVRTWIESTSGSRITVLLEDVKTGLPVATKTVADDSFTAAASMVAGYIARQIFTMDRTVPEWCWGVADGRDLGAMQLVRLERFYAACTRDVRDSRRLQISILTAETGTVRTAGIVRYELAQLLALDGQHLESLRLHALNRGYHRRFYRGRYRFAMSLEMLANPEHHLPGSEAARRKLADALEIIARDGHPDDMLLTNATRLREFKDPDGDEGLCMRVPRDLALKLLEIAAEDLRGVRTQLNAWHITRDALFHRDERAVWLPHLLGYRQLKSFQDGVCTAELLVAIRHRLRESAGMDPNWLKHARDRWHLRRAINTTWHIAGDPSLIYSVLANPHGKWWERDAVSRVRVHWPPWRRTRASWQTAYNTACLYAALADAARTNTQGRAPDEVLRDLENRVVTSLRHVVDSPDSELERAWDWIYSDPDFYAMRQDRETFTLFREFLDELEQQEYPASMAGMCPVPHPDNIGHPALSERRLASMPAPVYSPVPGPEPVRDDLLLLIVRR
jgi:hypothetical protein